MSHTATVAGVRFTSDVELFGLDEEFFDVETAVRWATEPGSLSPADSVRAKLRLPGSTGSIRSPAPAAGVHSRTACPAWTPWGVPPAAGDE